MNTKLSTADEWTGGGGVVARSPENDGRPGSDAAGTAAEFVRALRRLKNWSGMSYRQLEKRAARLGLALPRSTLMAALNRDVLPREYLVVALVRTCGGDQEEVGRWVDARRRIAAAPTPAVGIPAERMMPVRCTLPADQAVFVGRDKELEQIASAVADAAQDGGVIAIHAIDGMPGIGKTTLAVHVAHRLKDKFGDRQLFVDLHAHTPGQHPTEPADALAQLLAADGIDPRFLPGTVDGRAALWRDRMAGLRLLLVLDNAAGSQQVAPLLPGSTGSLVLVTSRRSLADLPAAVPVPLEVLTPDEAIAMFVRLVPRAAAEQADVAEVVRVCGYLPLAVSVMASLYARHRAWSIDDLLQEVRLSPGGSPLTLTGESRTVAAVFELSYRHLPAARGRLFRLLGLQPGPDIDVYAAAALTGLSEQEAQRHLDALHADHLLEEPDPRRYRMHDLIRAYTQQLAATTDPAEARHDAIGRLLDFYRHTTARAMEVAYPHERHGRPTVPPAAGPAPDLSDPNCAARWLDTELPNVLAAAAYANEHGWPEHLLHLSSILDRHLRTRGRYRDAQTLHQHAVDLAGRLGNHAAEMNALNGLGYLHWKLGDYEQAGDHHGLALKIAQAIGDRGGEMNALTGLGDVHRRLGDHGQAGERYRQAWGLAQAIGDRGGEMNALHGLGDVHSMRGEYEQAGERYRQALGVAQGIGDRGGEINALHGLGHVHRRLGDHERAGDQYRQALKIAQAIGDRGGEMNALTGLGDVHWMLDRHEQAGAHFERALRIAQAIGDRRGEINGLNGLGYVHWMLGRYAQAGDRYRQALRVAQATGDRRGEPQALTGLGHVHRMLGRHGEAADCYQQVLALAQGLHSSNWQYEALQGIGRLHHATGQPDLALTHHEQALQLATELTQPGDQARAHDGLAHAYYAKGRHDQARQHWQHALDILTSLGTEHTEDIEANVTNIRANLTKTMLSE